MKMALNCLKCNIDQLIKVVELLNVEEHVATKTSKELLEYLSRADFNKCNPEIMEGSWKIITRGIGIKDPYMAIKKYYNSILMEKFDDICTYVENSEDYFKTSMNIAVIGNIIDFGPNHMFSIESIMAEIEEESQKEILKINHGDSLLSKLKVKKSLLYIGDNCGEIVMDKVFIKYIQLLNPDLVINYAVRGQVILNDITLEDARMVALDQDVTVISNGSGAPGTVLGSVSDAFKEAFNGADIVIAKGQGNYESLSESNKENMFFLLRAKCHLIANRIGVPHLSCVCIENIFQI